MLTYAALAGALSYAMLGGIFFAFSDFIMRAFGLADLSTAITAMQRINAQIYRSLFLVFLLGMALFSLIMLILSFTYQFSVWANIASLCYLLGVMGVTIIFNIPLNKTLDTVHSSDTASADFWLTYLRRWTRWNHLRTLSAFAAAICMAIAATGQA